MRGFLNRGFKLFFWSFLEQRPKVTRPAGRNPHNIIKFIAKKHACRATDVFFFFDEKNYSAG